MTYAPSICARFRSLALAVAVTAAFAMVAALAPACAQKKLPGVAIGRYKLTGPQTTNTCGGGDNQKKTWDTSFINISRDGDTLYWDSLDGSPTMAIPLDAAGAGTLSSDVTGATYLPDGGPTSCTMSRHDVITVAFGTTKVPAKFTVSFSFAFSAADGSDCSSQLVSGGMGGVYATLPCSFSYDVTAALY